MPKPRSELPGLLGKFRNSFRIFEPLEYLKGFETVVFGRLCLL